MYLAIIGFILIIALMYVLIQEKMAPPLAFIVLPVIAAVLVGANITDLSAWVQVGLESILNTAVMFLFSISYFTLMSEQGLFDPLVDWIIGKVGKNMGAIFLAVLAVAAVAHLDGSGASTYLIAIPAFKPIMDRLNVRPTAFIGTVIAMMSAMNIVPWGGPTIRAASVAQVDVFDLYQFILPAVAVMFIVAIIIALFHARREKSRGAGLQGEDLSISEMAGDATQEPVTSKGLFYYNLILTVVCWDYYLPILACRFTLSLWVPML